MAKNSFPRADTTVAGGLTREDGGRWFNDSHRPLVFPDGRRAHLLKCAPIHFNQVSTGRKLFELRYDDRDYQEGDYLVLREWDREFTGTEYVVRVRYILRHHDGLREGYVAMSLLLLPWAEQARIIGCVESAIRLGGTN